MPVEPVEPVEPAGARRTRTAPGSRAAPRPAAKGAELPSGRHVVVLVDGGEERLEVRAPGGALEVEVRLTAEGPVVRLSGGRLELASTESVRLACKRLELCAEETASLRSGGDLEMLAAGEMDVRADEDMRIRGRMVYIN